MEERTSHELGDEEAAANSLMEQMAAWIGHWPVAALLMAAFAGYWVGRWVRVG